MRLGRFVRYMHMWEEILSMDYGTGENVIKCVQWLFFMLFLCHWNACILYIVPTVSNTGIPQNGTVYGPKDSYAHSWLYSSNIEEKPLRDKYFWVLFKSMSHMLTIGYGVNQPTVLADIWTSIYVMFSKYYKT